MNMGISPHSRFLSMYGITMLHISNNNIIFRSKRGVITIRIDGLVQDYSKSSALATELLQSCAKPSIYIYMMLQQVKNTYICILTCILWFPLVNFKASRQGYVLRNLPSLIHPLGHYSDVITGAMASQITSLTIVYSTVYAGADQGNIK